MDPLRRKLCFGYNYRMNSVGECSVMWSTELHEAISRLLSILGIAFPTQRSYVWCWLSPFLMASMDTLWLILWLFGVDILTLYAGGLQVESRLLRMFGGCLPSTIFPTTFLALTCLGLLFFRNFTSVYKCTDLMRVLLMCLYLRHSGKTDWALVSIHQQAPASSLRNTWIWDCVSLGSAKEPILYKFLTVSRVGQIAFTLSSVTLHLGSATLSGSSVSQS